jgi:transposase
MPTPYRKPSTVRALPKVVVAKAEALFSKIEGGNRSDGTLLDLPGWRVVGAVQTEHDVVIFALPDVEPESCKGCGAPASLLEPWGYTEVTFVRDQTIRNKRTRLYYIARRYRCTGHALDGSSCHVTARQPLPDVNAEKRATERLLTYVTREAFRPRRTFLSVADEVGGPESMVRDAFVDYAVRAEKLRVIETPKWLAMDEVHLRRKIYTKQYCVLTDPLRRRYIEILPNNKQETVAKTLLQLPNRHRIEVVSIDFCPTYCGAIHEVLPGADIVIDRRHAHEMVVRALKAFLELLREKMGKDWCRRNMLDPTPLFKRYHDLEEDEKAALEEWLDRVPELQAAYWLKEEFCNLYELPNSKEALDRYDDWVVKARATSAAFNSVMHTIKIWRPMVFGYNDWKERFPLKVTNGFAESANNQIKRLYRLCNGLGFWVLRAKLLFGEGFVRNRPPHPLDLGLVRERSGKSGNDAKRSKRKKHPSPDAHSERLRRAYEEHDQTQGLLSSPVENEGWRERFEPPSWIQPPAVPFEQLTLFQ